VLKRLKRSHSVHWVPIKALVYKVQKLSVATLAKHAFKSLGIRNPFATSAVGYNYWEKGVLFEKKVSAGGQLYDIIGWYTLDLHHVCELFSLIFSWEQRVSCIKLRHYAAKAPHINSGGVGDTENNLRGSVEATLNVGVDTLVLKARRSIVDYFYAGLVGLLK